MPERNAVSGDLSFMDGTVIDRRTGKALYLFDNGEGMTGSSEVLDLLNRMKRLDEDTFEFLERRGVIKKRS